MRKYLLAIPFIFLMLGCNDGGGGGENRNFCYIPDSSDPCFDPNAGGSTTVVTDQTVDEVIADEEGMPGFEGELEITDILTTAGFLGVNHPDCPWEQSELVIKTDRDWNRFRQSCLFSFFELPDVDFSSRVVLVSTQDLADFDTIIMAVLEFDAELVAVIEDEVAELPSPAPAFRFSIASIPKRDLPVDFVRVERDIIIKE